MSPRTFALRRIEAWQRHPTRPRGSCPYQPTCSNYAHQAITEYGLLRGGARTVWRVWRCNPCSNGGYDPVPPRRRRSAGNGNVRLTDIQRTEGALVAGTDWYIDPTGRHHFRYWNGSTWTEHVADGGTPATDAWTNAKHVPPRPTPATPDLGVAAEFFNLFEWSVGQRTNDSTRSMLAAFSRVGGTFLTGSVATDGELLRSLDEMHRTGEDVSLRPWLWLADVAERAAMTQQQMIAFRSAGFLTYYADQLASKLVLADSLDYMLAPQPPPGCCARVYRAVLRASDGADPTAAVFGDATGAIPVGTVLGACALRLRALAPSPADVELAVRHIA